MNMHGALPLLEAAKRLGVTVSTAAVPDDRFVQSDQVRLHFLDWNSQRPQQGLLPVLLLHGFAQNAHSWDFVALALAGNRRVVALDQRGHGDSDWAPDGDYSSEAAQADLASLVRHLGWERFILVGLSMGGRHAVTYAGGNQPRVAALVVVDIGPEVGRGGAQKIQGFAAQPDVLESFDAFVDRTRRHTAREEWRVRGSLVHSLKQLPDGRWTWKYDPVLRDPSRWRRQGPPDPEKPWSEWRSLDCPTLIVRGAQSDILAAPVAARMVAELDGRAQLVEVPGAGHLVPGDAPLAFETALCEFLEGLPEGR